MERENCLGQAEKTRFRELPVYVTTSHDAMGIVVNIVETKLHAVWIVIHTPVAMFSMFCNLRLRACGPSLSFCIARKLWIVSRNESRSLRCEIIMAVHIACLYSGCMRCNHKHEFNNISSGTVTQQVRDITYVWSANYDCDLHVCCQCYISLTVYALRDIDL